MMKTNIFWSSNFLLPAIQIIFDRSTYDLLKKPTRENFKERSKIKYPRVESEEVEARR